MSPTIPARRSARAAACRCASTGWAKAHSFHTGQTPVTKYNRALMQAILWDRLRIADVVGVTLISLDDAPRGMPSSMPARHENS